MRQRCVERPRFPVIALPWLLVVMLGVGGWSYRVHAASHDRFRLTADEHDAGVAEQFSVSPGR